MRVLRPFMNVFLNDKRFWRYFWTDDWSCNLISSLVWSESMQTSITFSMLLVGHEYLLIDVYVGDLQVLANQRIDPSITPARLNRRMVLIVAWGAHSWLFVDERLARVNWRVDRQAGHYSRRIVAFTFAVVTTSNSSSGCSWGLWIAGLGWGMACHLWVLVFYLVGTGTHTNDWKHLSLSLWVHHGIVQLAHFGLTMAPQDWLLFVLCSYIPLLFGDHESFLQW